MINIVLSFGERALLNQVKQLLEEGSIWTTITAEATSGPELISALRRRMPQLVIIGVDARPSRNVELLGDITRLYLGLPILAVGSDLEDTTIIDLIKSGAMGYLDVKDISIFLMTAIDSLVNRKTNFVSSSVADRVSEEVIRLNMRMRQQKLHPKEMQVMKMIAWQMSIEEIASQLAVSTRTVYTYRSRLMQKMGFNTVSALRDYLSTSQMHEQST